jgi:hypothetical protein
MARCWEQRGCDEEMQADCPHPNELQDRCPTKCAFAQCDRPTHELTVDPELIFDPAVDRETVIREECLYCAFFLRHGPRVAGVGVETTDDD